MAIMKRYAKHNGMQYLLVSLSSHLYLDKSNVLQYSTRKLKPSKSEIEKGKKGYLERYVVVDGVSGCLYLEYLISGYRDSLYGFLHRAWSKKNDSFPFCGIPKSLIVMPGLANPTFLDFLENKGIKALNPESGFASGIRVFRSVAEFEEYHMVDGGMWVTNSVNWPLDLKVLNSHCFSWLRQSYNGIPKSSEKESRFKLWQKNNTSIQIPSAFEDFVSELPRNTIENITKFEQQRHPTIKPVKKKRKYTAKTIDKAFELLFPAEYWFIDTDRESAKNKWCVENVENLEEVEIMINENKANDIFDMGLEYYDIGDYRSAMKEYRLALDVCPKLTDVHVHMGILFLERYKLDLAIECFEIGIEHWKKEHGVPPEGDGWVFETNRPYMRALHNLGLTCEKMKRWNKALSCYLELMQLNPLDHQGIRYLIGHIYHQLGDLKNAEIRYIEANDAPAGAWNLVYFYFQQELKEKAIRAFLKAMTVNKHVISKILYPVYEEAPPYTAMGSIEEAIYYRQHFCHLWSGNNEYLDFLHKLNNSIVAKSILDEYNSNEYSEFEDRKIAKNILESIKM